MRPRYSYLVTTVLFLLLFTAPVAALEGTDVWEKGASIAYELDYYQEAINSNLVLETQYDITDGPFTVEYTGMTAGKMVFVQSSDDIKVKDLLFDDVNTTRVENSTTFQVDPSTGLDQNGDYTRFFHDTSEWEHGYVTDFTLDDTALPTDTSKSYKVVGDPTTLEVGDQEVEVFDTRVSNFEIQQNIEGIPVQFKLSNLVMRFSADHGVLMGESFTIKGFGDFNGDKVFEQSVLTIEYSANAVAISEGVTYNQAPVGSLWLVPLGLAVLVFVRRRR